MEMKIIAGILALGVAFTAGWTTQGWRMHDKLTQQDNNQLSQQLTDSQQTIKRLDDRIGDIVTKTSLAATQAQATVDNLSQVNRQTSYLHDQVSQQTQSLQDEIVKLNPKCLFGADTQRLWNAASQKANAGRSALYPTAGAATH